MLKVLLVIGVVGIIGLALWTSSKMKVTSQSVPISSESSPSNQTVMATYQGMLPCGDCSGIETTLILYQDPETKNPTTYQMTSVYTGKNVSPLVENGSWSIIGGQGVNRNSVIYKLILTTGSIQNFLKTNDSLELLDSGLDALPNSIPSKLYLK